MYVRNAWYVAAWDHEVTDKPLGRILLGEPVVLYRKASGGVAALEDRCRHRRAPLSVGQVVGDTLQCCYHGMRFDAEGRCVEMPGQDHLPECPPLRAYPVVERHRWLWIWMGNPALANPDTIPALTWHEAPGWEVIGERFHVKGDYQMLLDIQLDQTHSKYVHPTTLANDGAMMTRPRVRRDGDKLHCERLMENIAPPPFFRRARDFGPTADYWIKWTYCAPATVYFDAGAADHGSGGFEGNMEKGVAIKTAHAITPESPNTCHHFWTMSRNFGVGDPAVSKALSVIRETFLEDVRMIEATQRIVDMDPDAPFVDVNADTPTIQARLLVSRMKEREAGAVAKAS